MAARLLTEHVDDGRGRCSACPVRGSQGRPAWPCTIAAAAGEAINAERARTGMRGMPCSSTIVGQAVSVLGLAATLSSRTLNPSSSVTSSSISTVIVDRSG